MKIDSVLKNIIRVVYVLLIAFVLLDLTVYSLHTSLHDVLQTAADSLEKSYYLSDILLVAIGGILFFLLMKARIPEIKKRYIWILSLAFLVIKITVSYLMIFKTNWDAGFLFLTATNVCDGLKPDSDYFSFFPNNIISVAFFRVCIEIARLVGVYTEAPGLVLIMVINTLFVVLGGVFVYDLAEYYSDNSTAFRSWIAYVLFIGMTQWNMITYTDSVGFIFPILVLWVYVKLRDEKLTVVKWALIAMLSYWGYKIKGPAILVFLALMVYEVYKAISERKVQIKKLCASVAAMVLALAVSIVLLSGVIASTGVEMDKSKDTGIGFLIMVGLSPWDHGTFNGFDYGMLTRYPDHDEFQAEVKSRIVERLRSYGPKGLLIHQMIKTMIVFNDGTFAWGGEGDFYKEPLSEKNAVLSPILKDIFWNDGRYFEAYATYMQMLWLATILGMLMYGILAGDKKPEMLILMMCVILMILFAETVESRARYLYTFAPIFCLTGTLGMAKIGAKNERKD